MSFINEIAKGIQKFITRKMDKELALKPMKKSFIDIKGDNNKVIIYYKKKRKG